MRVCARVCSCVSVCVWLRRYYTRFFAVDVKANPRHDQYVHLHSNCACVLGVTRYHALVTAGSPIVNVRFVLGKEQLDDVKVGVRAFSGWPGVVLLTPLWLSLWWPSVCEGVGQVKAWISHRRRRLDTARGHCR